MTILGPKLVSSEGRDGFLGNTIDSIFWQVSGRFFTCNFSQLSIASRIGLLRSTRCFAKRDCLCKGCWGPSRFVVCKRMPCCRRDLLSAEPCVGGRGSTYCGCTAAQPNQGPSSLCNMFGSILEFIFGSGKTFFSMSLLNLEPRTCPAALRNVPLFNVPWLRRGDAPRRVRWAVQVTSDRCFCS